MGGIEKTRNFERYLRCRRARTWKKSVKKNCKRERGKNEEIEIRGRWYWINEAWKIGEG